MPLSVTSPRSAGGEYAAIYPEQLAVRWLTELVGSCALHYALSEDHVESIVGAVREAGSVRTEGLRCA